MTEKQKAAKAAYYKEYRERNKAHINKLKKDWAHKHPDKIREYQARYWEKQADKMIDTLAAAALEG